MAISRDYNFKTKEYEKRYCRFCGEEVKGRVTKTYCNQQCRNNYRNAIISYKKKFDLKTESEAHNYFLLVKEVHSRNLLVSLGKIDLDTLLFNSFDIHANCYRFREKTTGKEWFVLGDLCFRIFLKENHVRVKHFTKVNNSDFDSGEETTVESVYPQLKQRTFYKGPM